MAELLGDVDRIITGRCSEARVGPSKRVRGNAIADWLDAQLSEFQVRSSDRGLQPPRQICRGLATNAAGVGAQEYGLTLVRVRGLPLRQQFCPAQFPLGKLVNEATGEIDLAEAASVGLGAPAVSVPLRG